MAIGARRLLGVVSVMMMATAFAASAQAQPVAPQHVRAESGEFRTLVQRTADQSPTVRALVDRLNQSDVVVYVRHALLPPGLDGRTGLLAVHGPTRYLVVEIACPRSPRVQSVTLAHELQHAVEIAGSPSVVNAATLERFYAGIGVGAGAPGRLTFETAAARAVGDRVRREIGSASSTRPF